DVYLDTARCLLMRRHPPAQLDEALLQRQGTKAAGLDDRLLDHALHDAGAVTQEQEPQATEVPTRQDPTGQFYDLAGVVGEVAGEDAPRAGRSGVRRSGHLVRPPKARPPRRLGGPSV